MIQLKTLNKRIATKSQGVFYKPVVNEQEKEVDKIYLIRWIDNDGREKLKTVGKYSQGVRVATCITLRNNTISAIALGAEAPHLTKVKSQLTLNDIAKIYFNSSKAKDIDRLESRYEIHFKNNLGKKKIDNISLEEIEDKQKKLLSRFAPATVNLTIGMISTIYNHHIKRGKKISNPAKGITHLKLDNNRERFLNNEEIKDLLDVIKDDIDCYIFVLLSLSTGGRLSTIMNISKKDINFEDVKKLLADGGDIAFAYDGDADRIAVLTHKNNIKGDMMALLYSMHMDKPTVIGEVKCSQVMYDELEKRGCKAIMYKTGHSNLKVKMKETNADLACEVSGHVFFKNRYFGYDDAIYATLRMLELIHDGIDLDAELAKLPVVFSTEEIKVKTTESEKFKIIGRVKEMLKNPPASFPVIKNIIDVDGVRINFENGWGLVRASNTTPVLVTRFESTSKDEALNYETAINKLIIEAKESLIKKQTLYKTK